MVQTALSFWLGKGMQPCRKLPLSVRLKAELKTDQQSVGETAPLQSLKIGSGAAE